MTNVERPRNDGRPAHVGIVGLGNMGGRMTRRLRAEGVEVTGHDIVPGAANAAGANEAADLSELAAAVDCILLSLPDSSVVEEVVLGRGGILEHARAGLVLVDLSTAAPSSTRRLSERLAAKGAHLLDAGISGGAVAAERGQLTLMVGGSIEVVDSVTPILELLASHIFHMGGVGTGHAVKLLNNFLNAVNLAASTEVMIAARLAGLDVKRVLDVINASSGENWATRNRFPKIVDGDYLEGGLTSQLMMKDVALYLGYIAELGAPSLNSTGPVASFGIALHKGYGDMISNRVVDAIGDIVGGIRLDDRGPVGHTREKEDGK